MLYAVVSCTTEFAVVLYATKSCYMLWYYMLRSHFICCGIICDGVMLHAMVLYATESCYMLWYYMRLSSESYSILSYYMARCSQSYSMLYAYYMLQSSESYCMRRIICAGVVLCVQSPSVGCYIIAAQSLFNNQVLLVPQYMKQCKLGASSQPMKPSSDN